METLRGWDQLQRVTGAVARRSPGYSSNLYAAPAQIDRWGASGRLRVLVSEDAVLVLRAARGFWHVYHTSEGARALEAALITLPSGRYVADLITREAEKDAVCAPHVKAGFTPHTWLRRMSLLQQPATAREGGAEPGRPEEARAILDLMERLLDPLAEQLPDGLEIDEALASRRLLVSRDGDTIRGMLMFDLKGQLAHLRFWHVDATAQGRGIGRTLMTGFLARVAPARRIVLWVIGSNDRSIAIYRHYGFVEDDLVDYIMLLDRG